MTLARSCPVPCVASLVLNGLHAVSQLYLPGRFSGASELYGGIGVAVVTLGWLFFVGRTWRSRSP